MSIQPAVKLPEVETSSKAGLQTLYAPIVAGLEAVKDSIASIVPPDSYLLAKTVDHSLTGGGKYLRPALTLLAGTATRQEVASDIDKKLVESASVAELIHVATLLHDDVLDDSELRRGKRTVRADWGNRVSVLTGDYILAQASLKLAHIGNSRLVEIFSYVLADLCDAEVEQIRTSYQLDEKVSKNSIKSPTSWDSYYRKTIGKTASLFSAGCESAGVLNQLPEEHIQSLKQYGRQFGIAFQIVDDLLDYTSTEADLGKPVLDDLRNGLLNAPVLLALESDRLSKQDKAELKKAIEALFTNNTNTPAVDTDESEIISVIRGFLDQADAIEQTRRLARQYAEEAIQSVDFIAPGEAKNAMTALVEAAIYRQS